MTDESDAERERAELEKWLTQYAERHTSSLGRYLATLSDEDRWAHCGDGRRHGEHRSFVSTNEAKHPVTCVGTPDLTPAPGPVTELLERVAAPSLAEAYDQIRAHLRDWHGFEWDLVEMMSDSEVSGAHFGSHHDPECPVGHGEPLNLHDFRGANYIMMIRPDGVAPEDVVPTPPLLREHGGPTQIPLDNGREWSDADLAELRRATRPGAQPLPTTSDREGAHDALLREHLRDAVTDRKMLGLTRYHSLLQAGNGRDSLRDAVEEALDLAAYLQVWTQARDEALELLSELRVALVSDRAIGEDPVVREHIETIRKIEHLLGGGTEEV